MQPNNDYYAVFATLEANEGHEDALKKALLTVVEPSRAETTCLEYRLHQDSENPAQFIIYEIWENQASHQQQFEKPYIKKLATEIPKLLLKPYQVTFAKEL